MTETQRDRLLVRLHGAKFSSREEIIEVCKLAAEEILRLDYDRRALYELLMRHREVD